MAEPKILRGIYKDGPLVVSAIIEEGGPAKLMAKGVEPLMPVDPAFTDALKKIAKECASSTGGGAWVEIHVVLARAAAIAEAFQMKPSDLEAMKVRRVVLIDAACGLPVRMVDDEPLAVTLAYESLRAGGDLKEQPGCVEVPQHYPRKLYKDLKKGEQKVFEIVVQRAGRGLMKIVALEEEGLKLAVGLRDLPPARARSAIVPIGDFGKELDEGTHSIEEIAKRLEVVRSG